MKFKTVEDEIRPILQDDMMARYDDMYLYYLMEATAKTIQRK